MPERNQPATFFAPAERASAASVQQTAELCLNNPVAQALLDAVAGHALILNAERQVVAASPETLATFGLTSPEALCGLRPGEVLGCVHVGEGPGGCGTAEACAQCGAVLSILSSQSEGVPVNAECLLSARKDNRPISMEFKVRACPVELEGQPLTVFILQDLSGQKRREALEHLVFHEFHHLVGNLDSSARELLEHPEQVRLTARQIQEMSAQLSQELVGQRVLAGAEEGTLVTDPRDIRVRQVLEELAQSFQASPLLAERELETHPGPDGILHSDPVLLQRVLTLLLRNALEATPRGGKTFVRYLRQADRHRLQIENPGTIAAPVAQRIFQRSFSTKAAKGRGLGTYTAKLLSEACLGGTLGFEVEDHRVLFHLDLPLRPEAAAPVRAAEPEERQEAAVAVGSRPSTVLVVDDSRTVRQVLSSILGKEHRIVTASHGEEGLKLALEETPDLILLDVVMPGLDGYAVCARLKSDPRTEEIPVLFLSGLSGDDDETLALEAGAIDFILKPIRPVAVAARVRNHLELKRTRDQLRDLTLLDGLTGIANRRRFDRQLQAEWQRARRNGTPLSVILGDVDFFKRFNDHYGHAQGDECLKAVAQSFQRGLMRPGDLAARYGGEEFVCILPETPAEGALEVAERIRREVRACALPHAASDASSVVSVSLGVATSLPPHEGRPEEMLATADARLYQAKAQGRDRTVG